MTEIKHRQAGTINSKYYEEKAKLMSKREIGLCIICGKDMLTKAKNRLYCSDECFNKWFSQFNPPFLWNDIKRKVRARDNFKCVKCAKVVDEGNWTSVIDHILPIALGGDEWDLTNLQTLCVECNAIKTREDQRNIGELRRLIKKEKLGVSLKEFYKQTKLSIPPSDKSEGILEASL